MKACQVTSFIILQPCHFEVLLYLFLTVWSHKYSGRFQVIIFLRKFNYVIISSGSSSDSLAFLIVVFAFK